VQLSTLTRKSLSDLRRRPVRSLLTILTIAVAVAGIGIFAMPGLIDGAMQSHVTRDRIHDASVQTVDLQLTPAQVADLRAVDNVASLQLRSVFRTRVWVGARRTEAVLIGVPDFADQPVDRVTVLSGEQPVAGQVLVDPAAERAGRWHGQVGDGLRLITGIGDQSTLFVVGKGESLQFSSLGDETSSIVLYATDDTVRRFGRFTGTNLLEVHFRDGSSAAAQQTMNELRARLDAVTGGNSFTTVPVIRPQGTWPGQEGINQFESLLVVVAFVALFSAIFLIANTMNTLVAEQRREIGVMKAVGGSKRDIKRTYRRTALLFGLAGGVSGAVLAVGLANVLSRYLGSLFYGVSPSWTVPPLLVGGALVLGVAVTVLAAVPAVRRSTRMPVREALDELAGSGYGMSRLDRAVRRLKLTPMANVGLRSVTRRKGRSAATVVQVAISIAIMIGFLTLSYETIKVMNSTWDQFATDIGVRADATGKPLPAGTGSYLATIPGVARVENVYVVNFELRGEPVAVWALPAGETSYRPNIRAGRWLAGSDDGAYRMVIGDALARVTGTRLGDTVEVATPVGPKRFEVIGIDNSLVFNGRMAYVPLPTMRAIVGDPQATNGYWIQATDRSPQAVDALSTAVEDRLVSLGVAPSMQVFHAAREENLAMGRSITTTITVLGLLIVAISMIGLVNAISMNVIDRTREIGVLRCIGARSADLRRAFRIEGLTLTILGWLVGIPLGVATAWLLTQLVFNIFQFRFPFTFAMSSIWVALAGALAVALVVMIPPLHRAARLRPGDALRYQ